MKKKKKKISKNKYQKKDKQVLFPLLLLMLS